MEVQELKIKSEEEAEVELFELTSLSDLPEMKHSVIGDLNAEIGIVLQHGYCGSNLEMLYLANYLAREGYRIIIPLLPGHGQNSDALLTVDHEDWQQTVIGAIEFLKAELPNREIILAGHSLGGALALSLGHREDINAIISIAGPIQYRWYERMIMNIFGFLTLKIPFETFHFYDKRLHDHPGMKNFHENYGKVPISSLAEVFNQLKVSYANLSSIRKPVCLIYSDLDNTVPPYHATKIHQKLSSKDLEIHWLSQSYHIMVVDEDRELVAQKILSFLSRISQNNF